jgi:hypothetical protein
MKRKFVAALVAAGVALAVGPVAFGKTDAGKSGPKRAYQFHGTVSAVTADEDPVTADSITVTVTKANGNGKSLVGTDVVVSVSDATKYYGAASTAGDIAVGDAVKVKARNNGAGFDGQRVKEKSASEEGDSE